MILRMQPKTSANAIPHILTVFLTSVRRIQVGTIAVLMILAPHSAWASVLTIPSILCAKENASTIRAAQAVEEGNAIPNAINMTHA
jgi:hypothetical protein